MEKECNKESKRWMKVRKAVQPRREQVGGGGEETVDLLTQIHYGL
jgi:hypothetical protein